jgi:hypothetical protein
MPTMNIPDKIYHGYYNRVDKELPTIDDNTKWALARKQLIDTLRKDLGISKEDGVE